MMKTFTLLLAVLCLSALVHAQNSCLTVYPWEEPDIIETHSEQELSTMRAEFFNQIQRYQKEAKESPTKAAETLRIPMVVHIIHSYGPENLPDSEINHLVDVLNDDFNANYPNKNLVFDEFQDILGNTEVEFRLAKLGPNGECVSGINRVAVNDAYFSNYADGRNQIENIKRDIHWPTDKYMNVYIVGSIGGSGGGVIGGYATFPRNEPFPTDGFVTIYNLGFNDHGGISSHEIGHYLGLPHTFGCGAGDPNSCSPQCDDGIEDTPNTIGYPSICPSKANAVSCGTLDNVHNIMDYSSCPVNFTIGQSDVMRGVLLNQRSNLVSDENLVEVGADYDLSESPKFLCTADFDAQTNLPFCPGAVIDFSDITTHDALSFSWSFEGGTPETSSERNPSVTYSESGNFQVSLTVADADTSITVVKENFIQIQDNNVLGDAIGEGFENIDLENTDRMQVINPDNDRTFTVNEDVGSASAKSMYIQNRLIPSGRTDEMITNTMDISGVEEPILSFDYAFAKRSENNTDELQVFISSDCGVTWTRRKLFRSNINPASSSSLVTAPDQSSGDFVPSTEEWKNYTVSVEGFKSDGFKLRLDWLSGGGNNLYIDNLYIGAANAVGINENMINSAINLFPNPSTGEVNISSEMGAIEAVQVYNALGTLVHSQDASTKNLRLNLNHLSKGVYVVQVGLDNGHQKRMSFSKQ